MTLEIQLQTAAAHSAPIVRTNLSRFGIYLDMPPAIAALILDIVDHLPNCYVHSFLKQLDALRTDADLSRTPAQFLHWLLLDAQYGAINLTRRDDVKDTINSVASLILQPLIQGESIHHEMRKAVLFPAQLAQLKTWHDYEHRSAVQGMQPRIEWMLATAATDSMLPHLPEQIIGVLHSCAVAWSAHHRHMRHATALYQAAFARLFALLATQPASDIPQPQNCFDQISKHDRVAFDDIESGAQTGRVLDLSTMPDGRPSAWVELDHALPGCTQNVPLSDLRRLVNEPA